MLAELKGNIDKRQFISKKILPEYAILAALYHTISFSIVTEAPTLKRKKLKPSSVFDFFVFDICSNSQNIIRQIQDIK